MENLENVLEVRITKLCGKRKTKLFCKKHEALITPSFNAEHGCLKPKRVYTNSEGKKVIIYCPHLMTLKGTQFYREHEPIIYENLEGVYELETEFKHAPQPLEKTKKEDLFKRQARTLRNLVNSGRKLTSGSG